MGEGRISFVLRKNCWLISAPKTVKARGCYRLFCGRNAENALQLGAFLLPGMRKHGDFAEKEEFLHIDFIRCRSTIEVLVNFW